MFINAAGDAGDPAYPVAAGRTASSTRRRSSRTTSQTSLEWRRTLSTTGYTEVQLSRYFFAQRQRRAGQALDATTRAARRPAARCPATRGAPTTSSSTPATTTSGRTGARSPTALSWSLTQRIHRNEIELGFEHQFQTVQYLTIEDPWVFDPDGLGGAHDLWQRAPVGGQSSTCATGSSTRASPPTSACARTTGSSGREAEQALADIARHHQHHARRRASSSSTNTHSFFGRRYKMQDLAAHHRRAPDHREQQLLLQLRTVHADTRRIRYVYSKLTSISSESFPLLGNPNLNPQVSVNYEVGAKHQFLPTAAVNATFFVKDIYDYPVATHVQALAGHEPGADIFVYLNGHFARSKGFEVELEKRAAAGYWSGKLSYTFQQTQRARAATRTRQKVAAAQRRSTPPRRGCPRRSCAGTARTKLTANFDLRFDDKAPVRAWWLKQTGINVYVQGESGRAYTPTRPRPRRRRAEPFSQNALVPDDRSTSSVDRYLPARRPAARRRASRGLNMFGNRIINRVDSRDRARAACGAWGEYDPNDFPDVERRTPKVSEVDDPSNYGPPAPVEARPLDYRLLDARLGAIADSRRWPAAGARRAPARAQFTLGEPARRHRLRARSSRSASARATGLGEAFVAVANDPTAIYWNPAGLASIQRQEIAVSHVDWPAGHPLRAPGPTWCRCSKLGGSLGVPARRALDRDRRDQRAAAVRHRRARSSIPT